MVVILACSWTIYPTLIVSVVRVFFNLNRCPVNFDWLIGDWQYQKSMKILRWVLSYISDLPDGGSNHLAETVREIKKQ